MAELFRYAGYTILLAAAFPAGLVLWYFVVRVSTLAYFHSRRDFLKRIAK